MLQTRVHGAGRVIRRLVGPLFWLVLAALTAAPAAAADGSRILLLRLDGWAPEKLNSVVAKALPKGSTLVPAQDTARAAQMISDSSTKDDQAYADAARQVGAAVVIKGNVSKDDNKWRLVLVVRRGADGVTVGTGEWTGAKAKSLETTVARGAPTWLASTLSAARGETAPAASPTSEAAAASSVAEEGNTSSSRRTPARPSVAEAAAEVAAAPEPGSLPIWELAVGAMVLGRTFSYMDNQAGLPGYTLAGGAGLTAEGTVFPLATMDTALSAVGISGALESSVAVKTVGRNGAASLDTSMRSYRVGLRYRAPVYRTLVTAGLDYAQDQSAIDVPDTTPPNVRYTFLRPSVNGRINTTPKLFLTMTLAYLHVLSLGGELASEALFPRDQVRGVEADAGIGYAVDENFELKVLADLRHFAHTMHAKTGDPYLVGGAVDEHFGVALLVSYRGH
jgi:hypothetical protein